MAIISTKTIAVLGAGRPGHFCRMSLVEYERIGIRLDLRRFSTDAQGRERQSRGGVSVRANWISALRLGLDELEAASITEPARALHLDDAADSPRGVAFVLAAWRRVIAMLRRSAAQEG